MSWATWPAVGVTRSTLQCPSCGHVVPNTYDGMVAAKAHRCQLTPEEEEMLS